MRLDLTGISGFLTYSLPIGTYPRPPLVSPPLNSSGHKVRGPLTLLRKTWEVDQGREEPVNVISYVIQMREKLQRMSELAQTHMVEAKLS